MDRTRASLSRVLWLGSRIDAKSDFITDKQVFRFGRHPHGSVPELCVESKRLPASFGTSDQQANGQKIEMPAVTPDGKPCILTVINGMNVVVCGDTVYNLLPNQSNMDPEYGFSYDVRLLGFAADGKPVTHVSRNSIVHERGQHGIFFGSEMRFVNEINFHGATLLGNDDVIYYTVSTRHNVFLLYRNETMLCEFSTPAPMKQFFELPSGAIVGHVPYHMAHSHDALYYTNGTTAWSRMGLDQPDHVEIRSTKTGLHVVGEKCWEGILVEDQSDWQKQHGRLCWEQTVEPKTVKKPFGKNPYRGNYKKLDDGRIVYTGKTTRDDLLCMVVNGEPQPSFEQVSPLFQRDGVWMYYGLIDQHVYTMEIPEATKK